MSETSETAVQVETVEEIDAPAPPPAAPPKPVEKIEMRWVPKSAVITPRSQCLACGAEHGTYGLHDVIVCPACWTRQCADYTNVRGACPMCLVGILPLVTPRPTTCECKGCTNTVAAWLLGRARCLAHFNQARPFHMSDRHLVRHNTWRMCESVSEPE